MPGNIVEKPNYWRMRAEELRAQAETQNYVLARDMMYQIADQYDRLAQVLEQELRNLLDPDFGNAGARGNVTALRPMGG